MPAPTDSPYNVVGEVVANHLCSGCGVCVAVCKASALAMHQTAAGFRLPALITDRCTGCGNCVRACPGLSMEPAASKDSPWVGDIRAAYWGRARDDDVCLNGASGGALTQMLRTLLCEDRIDAALITRWDEHSPLGPAVTLVTSPEEFSSSQKSKYCQVPWGEALGDLEAFEGRIAVVGLPCHIQGLENARRLRPAFCRNIVLKVGLLCDRILSFAAIDRLLETAGVPACEVAEFEYRHKAWRGWPGDVCIKARDGRRYNLPRKERMRIKDIHTPARCWVCPDKFNVLADVCFGDGYGGPESKEGMSLALVRTQAGAEALSLALPHLDIVEVALDKGLAEHKPEAREARSNAGVSALLKLRPAAACPLLDKLWTGEAPSRKSLRRIKYALRVESADTPERARSLRGRWQGRKFRRFLRRLFG